MADNNTQRTGTSTQIRNLYSNEMAYMNIRFFNMNLSLTLYPFQSKDPMGKSTYDMQAGQTTTVNFESAFALYQVSKDIIDGKVTDVNLVIPCSSGATLLLDRKPGPGGIPETTLTLNKNNVAIPFRFQNMTCQAKEGNKNVTKVIESGLGAFAETIKGYLNGINADRHLDKYTDDYVKSLGGQQQSGGQFPPQSQYPQRQQYPKQQRPYPNKGGGNYPSRYGGGQRQGGWGGPPKQQNMSSYEINR